MIDLHSHVLPGLDDGAATIDEALEMCAAVAAEGVEVLVATPHVRAVDYPTTPEQMEAALARLLAENRPSKSLPSTRRIRRTRLRVRSRATSSRS